MFGIVFPLLNYAFIVRQIYRFFNNKSYSFISNTANISQCLLPVNWSTGINVVILYLPDSKTAASRLNVFGLHDIYIMRFISLDFSISHCANAPARGGSITIQSYVCNIPIVNGWVNRSRFTPVPTMSNPSAFSANVKFPNPQNKSATLLNPLACFITCSRRAFAPWVLGCKNAFGGYSTAVSPNVTMGFAVSWMTLSFHVMRIAGSFIAAFLNSGVTYGTEDVIAISMPLSHSVIRQAPEPHHGNFCICGNIAFISGIRFGHESIAIIFLVLDSKKPNRFGLKQKSARRRSHFLIQIGESVVVMPRNSDNFLM